MLCLFPKIAEFLKSEFRHGRLKICWTRELLWQLILGIVYHGILQDTMYEV
ncbi:hypothetical protein LINPERHAP2_LOCUS16707 [Linum perenne]